MAVWIYKAGSCHHVVSLTPSSIDDVFLKLFTCSTLFWGGDIFAPKLSIEDKHGKTVPVQQFLQNCFLSMWDEVTKAVGDLEAVIGFQVGSGPITSILSSNSSIS